MPIGLHKDTLDPRTASPDPDGNSYLVDDMCVFHGADGVKLFLRRPDELS